MSIETSLVTQNRLAQFAARFEVREDGTLVYFHPDGREGLPCTQAEAAQLIVEFEQTHQRSLRGVVFWVIACGLILGVLEASGVAILPRWGQYAIFLAPFPFVWREWYHAKLRPLLFLEGRVPVAPPRTVSRARHTRFAALPASLMVTMLLPAAGLTYYAAQTGWEVSHALIVGSNLFLAAAWVMARWTRSVGLR